jgi:hypothetical protein
MKLLRNGEVEQQLAVAEIAASSFAAVAEVVE